MYFIDNSKGLGDRLCLCKPSQIIFTLPSNHIELYC